MGPKTQECSPCGQGRGLRVVAVLTATALALTATVVLTLAAGAIVRGAKHARLELPNATRLLADWLVTPVEHGPGCAALAMLGLFALLMAPYFVACACVPREERGSAGAVAFRLAIQIAWCASALLFGLLALALPFACL